MGARASADVHAGEELKLPVSSQGARRVGRYLLCDQIGSGGMATIHLARLLGPQGFSRTVAVKQLHPQFAQNPQFVAMLLDEARLAVRVRHGNVISPLDIVATESELFIVMDYVNGESLANLLAASDVPLRPAVAAAVLVQVLLGLNAAHEATREQGEALGLVHRDVSPQNILVGQDGVARMLDFGIAKAVARTQTTDGGMVKGKLGYMAPEQIRLEPVDRRTDLFSAGVVLWEALTGTGLFVADALGASLELILHGEIAPPSRFNSAVTPELDAVVLKALERNRDARFQDAVSFAAALERATPLASALEVIDWVEKLAGPELERRAGLVRRAEALTWEPVHTTAPSLAAMPPEGRGTGWAETLPIPSDALRRTPTLMGLANPEGQIGERALAPTSDSTGVALGGDREASGPAEAKSGRRWRSVGLTLGIALAGITVAAGVLSLSGTERKSSLAVAREVPADGPALVIAVNPPPSEPPKPAPPEREAREPSRSLSSLRAVPSDDAAAIGSAAPAPSEPGSGGVPGTGEPALSSARAKPARAARDDASRPSARGSSPSPLRPVAGARQASAAGAPKAGGKSSRTAAGKKDGMSPRASSHCSPPWVINEQQVKVFKAECLR